MTIKIKLLKAFDFWVGGAIAFLLPKKSNVTPASINVIPAPAPKLQWGKAGIHIPIKSILIIRPGGMGDAVFLLPILKALNNQGIKIDILCEQRNAEIFTSQSHLLNKVYLYDQWPSGIFANSYDRAIDTEQWHYLSAIVSYFIKAKYNIGFATRPPRAKLFNQPIPYGENEYELNNFKKLFEGFLPSKDTINDINNCFEVPHEAKQWALRQIPDKSVSVFLGASIALRRLTVGQLLIIIRDLLAKDYHPVLLGGRDVIAISRQVVNKSNDQRVLDFVGKISLVQSAALIQRSKKFIGPDSGLMHLACAVGTPVIAVFGPGNLKKWGPKGDGHKIITENVICSPCTRYGYTVPTCGGSYHCMKDIKIEKIWNN